MSAEAAPTGTASIHRIPSLDGLRALSIFLVVALHSLQRLETTRHVPYLWAGIFDGGTGVTIFFVISGYLITSLLLREHEKTGSISFRGFYFRRAMRILPPLYFYVGVLLLLGWAGRLPIYKLDIYSALFFFHDYALSMMWSLEHFWSLSIEEQFYFLWPLILFYCLRRPGAEGRLKATKVAIAIILVSPVVRVLCFTIWRNTVLKNGYSFHMREDSLMFGCLFALVQGTPLFERIYAYVTRIWWIPPAVILLSDLIGSRFQNYWNFPLGFTVCGAAIAFFLLWCVRNPTSALGRFLNSRIIVHIGVLSYSIYIWQTFFLHHLNKLVFPPSLSLVYTFPFSWLAILVAAEISYHFVEQPSLRLRSRLIQSLGLYRQNRRIRQATLSNSKV
ncbi:acyltransferase [Granulicella sp. S190]|jgi:peptidoglycan/LPS O-acetylase OafA/YrhL|uniref:acyltransferase family protein n=1 Tax=Granulicella sp. S190 TaxID=1747226 RepID=UPI00131E8CCE|nr:acyltransferase [Granulicella sp. S190]